MDQKPLSESHATSPKLRLCREAWEELLREQPVPLGDQMEQLARPAEQPLTLRAAELVRRDGADEAVAGGGGVLLLDKLAAQSQRGTLRAQPGEHAPEGAVVQGPVFFGRRARLLPIACRPTSRADRLATRTPVALQVAGGQVQQRRSGVALIREYESRGNR
jgi:hypothetical protein